MMNLNKYTYDITCYWYKAINFNPIYNGIDYSQIIRFYLWDKIGRAIRIENKIDFDEEDALNIPIIFSAKRADNVDGGAVWDSYPYGRILFT